MVAGLKPRPRPRAGHREARGPDVTSETTRLAVGSRFRRVGSSQEVQRIDTVTLVSFAYPEVGGERRAELVSRFGSTRSASLGDAFVLSTCLRFEMAVPGDKDLLEDRLTALFGSVPEGGTWLSGLDAVVHLFRVAAGLASPIRGEPEVLTQFRRALENLKKRGTGSGRFIGLLERAVAGGRSAREHLPDAPHGSLATVAAELAAPAGRVAVLGAGEMAMAAAAKLRAEKVDVTVVCRRPDAVAFDGPVWPFDRAEEAVLDFPAVISATSAKRRLIEQDRLLGLLSTRRERLLLIDLAMPPDFSPPPGAAVDYVGIDEIAARVVGREEEDLAERSVAEAADEAWRWFADLREVGPLIADWYRAADRLVDKTVRRFAGRLTNPEDAAVLRQAAHTVARSLLAGPVARLRRSDRPEELAEELSKAFDVLEES